MAREMGSGRLYKFWLLLAFTLGTAGGTLASYLLHTQNTLWIILFLGAVTGAVAIFEQFGDSRGRGLHTPINPARWRGRSLPSHPLPPLTQTNGKRSTVGWPKRWQIRAYSVRPYWKRFEATTSMCLVTLGCILT